MEKFYCPKCDKIFEAEGEKKEWQEEGRIGKKKK